MKSFCNFVMVSVNYYMYEVRDSYLYELLTVLETLPFTMRHC